jgi:hypothetical protein
MKTMTADPKRIAENAKEVLDQHERQQDAIADELDAYVELLDEVMMSAATALDALVSAIPDRDGGFGLCLVRGEGETVWWSQNGSLQVIRGQHASSITPKELVERYGRHAAVDAVIQISVALDAQLRGGKNQSTQRTRRRADQIRALAVLARGIS